MKNIKRFSDYLLIDESISWSSVKSSYKRAKEAAIRVLKAFRNESRETVEMMKVFNYQFRKKLNLDTRGDAPSEDEIRNALEQLKDIPKLAPYAVILLSSPIPFSSTMYTGAAIYIKKATGGFINLLPSSFNDIFNGLDNEEIKENQMDFIDSFKLFESLNFELPKTKDELDRFLDNTEGRDLKRMLSISRGNPVIRINAAKSIEISSIRFYDLKVAKNGNISYGSMRVNSKYMPTFNSPGILIDFLTIYSFSMKNSISFPSIEDFVYNGKQISDTTYHKCIKNPQEFEIIVEIAKRYNSPDLIDRILSVSSGKNFIPVTEEFIKNTRGYKYFSPIFDFYIEQHYHNTLVIRMSHLTPFGAFSLLETDEDRSLDYISVSTDLRFKTEAGLDKAISKMIYEHFSWASADLKFIRSWKLQKKIQDDDVLMGYALIVENIIKDILEDYNSGSNQYDVDKNRDLTDSLLRKYLDDILIKNPTKFSESISSLEKTGYFSDIVKYYKEKYPDNLKTGDILSRFKGFN